MDYKDDIEANEYIMTIIKYILPFKLNTDGPSATKKKSPGFELCILTAFINGAILQNFTIPAFASIHQYANKARIVVTIHLSDETDLPNMSADNCVFDTQYSALGPSPRE